MDADFLTRLQGAATAEERQALLLDLTLDALSPALRAAVDAAALPHWFDAPFLGAILDDPDLDRLADEGGFAAVTALNFVEAFPGRGFNVHDQTRGQLLARLWREDPDHFRTLSERAAAYAAGPGDELSDWRIEETYHRLVSAPEAGLAQLRLRAYAWRNFPNFRYDRVESLTSAALEHVEAGRLGVGGAGWARFWQAHLELLYGREEEARRRLEALAAADGHDPALAAELNRALGDLYAQAGRHAEAGRHHATAVQYYQALEQPLEAEIVRRQSGAAAPAAAPAAPAGPIEADGIRHQLLANIKTVWIDGVLKQSLPRLIALDMALDPDQLAEPAHYLLHQPDRLDQALPAGISIERIFDHSNGSLLILGAPGSGKTTTLLQLLSELHERAAADATAPIPLVFNLSSWGNRRGELGAWLVEEAYRQYQLGRSYTRGTLLPEGELLLLLDGLDEVPPAARDACVAAINDFREQFGLATVVCSRTTDYEALRTRLDLAEAIVLQPLTEAQIESFLAQGGEATETLRQLVRSDEATLELARSPLMLNIMTLAYAGEPTSALADLETLDARRRHLLERYVGRMLARTPVEADGYRPAQVRRWLSHLARTMQRQGRSILYVEELPPPQTHWLRLAYHFLTGVVAMATLGMIPVLAASVTVGAGWFATASLSPVSDLVSLLGRLVLLLLVTPILMLVGGLLGGLIGGPILGLGLAVAHLLIRALQRRWLRLGVSFVAIWSSIVIVPTTIVALSTSPQTFGQVGDGQGFYEFVLGSVAFFVGALAIGVSLAGSWAVTTDHIVLRERLRPKRPSFARLRAQAFIGLVTGTVIGLSVGLIVTVAFLLIGRFLPDASLILAGISIIWVLAVIPLAGLGLILGGITSAVDSPPIDRRLKPAGGLRVSFRNGVVMAVIAGVLLATSGQLLGVQDELAVGFLILMLANILPLAFFFYGGLGPIQHVALRLLSRFRGRLPLRLVRFLDAMTGRALLRRVGGGYIFMHRSLLEYFASLDD